LLTAILVGVGAVACGKALVSLGGLLDLFENLAVELSEDLAGPDAIPSYQEKPLAMEGRHTNRWRIGLRRVAASSQS